MNFKIELDKRTREVVTTGPDGFTHTLEPNTIAHSFGAIEKLLGEVYEAGHAAGLKERAGLATKKVGAA